MKNEFDIETSYPDLRKFIDFAATAGSYYYIYNNTQEIVRQVEIFDVLRNKFQHMTAWNNSELAKSWVENMIAQDPDKNLNYVMNFLQGHGAGEVDAIRYINGSLRGLLYKAEFIKDYSGHIPSNTDTIDLVLKNRFTGEVVKYIQVKSNWTYGNLKKTLIDFVNRPNYNENIVLFGPKELIEEAHEMGLKNPTIAYGTIESNRNSGEQLIKLIQDDKAAILLTPDKIFAQVSKGALIGAAIKLTLSSFMTYIRYKNGEITLEEAFKQVGKDTAKGAIVGGTLAGLSFLFPPGILGLGVAIVVGSSFRKFIDEAFGDGTYAKVLSNLNINNVLMGQYISISKNISDALMFERCLIRYLNKSIDDFKKLDQISNYQNNILENKIKSWEE